MEEKFQKVRQTEATELVANKYLHHLPAPPPVLSSAFPQKQTPQKLNAGDGSKDRHYSRS
jgi:hypothetical protein